MRWNASVATEGCASSARSTRQRRYGRFLPVWGCRYAPRLRRPRGFRTVSTDTKTGAIPVDSPSVRMPTHDLAAAGQTARYSPRVALIGSSTLLHLRSDTPAPGSPPACLQTGTDSLLVRETPPKYASPGSPSTGFCGFLTPPSLLLFPQVDINAAIRLNRITPPLQKRSLYVLSVLSVACVRRRRNGTVTA